MNVITTLRKNIGTIIAGLGFILLCIVTFGDLGELSTEEYWRNVRENITAISFMSIGLTFIQTAIRQGVAEQALQRGLNTERTTKTYDEHKGLIKKNNEKLVYLPYFLQTYNKRHTKLRKQEFLINNNFSSEKSLYASNRKDLIKKYDRICVHLTAASIKWSTTKVVYNKNGRIVTLDEYRRRRLSNSIITSIGGMIGVTFLTGGLFFTPGQEPFWQKLVKLFTYCVAIAISAIFTVIKEYEKGAFGVPNDLDEINQIWREFEAWSVPDWVTREMDELNREQKNKECKEVKDERKEERAIECRTDLQKESQIVETFCNSESSQSISVPVLGDDLLHLNDEEQSG